MTRSGRSLRIPERYTFDLGVLAPTKDKFGYQMDINALAMVDIDPIEEEAILVVDVLVGGFDHTSEFKVMKYDKAMKTKDRKKWEISVEEEHERMKKYKVWILVKMHHLPNKENFLTSAWAIKMILIVIFVLG